MHDDRLVILMRVLFVIAAIILLAGCSSLRVGGDIEPHIEGIYSPMHLDNDPHNLNLAYQNKKILDKYYGEERQYYPSNAANNIRPKTGLALSGGGMRSASFSIGVMTGLAKQKDVFDSIDIISAVSGGSYAASWYYLQQYYMMQSLCKRKYCGADNQCGKPYDDCLEQVCKNHPSCKACLEQMPAKLLDPDDKFQKRLSEHGDLTGTKRGLLWSALNILTIPFNFLFNGIFDWQRNTAISRWFYQRRIEDTFHRIPENVCDGNETNGMPGPDLLTLGLQEKSVTFPDLSKFIQNRKLPGLIVNATVQLDDDPWHHGSKLSNSVFEFAPLRLGSSGVGFAGWQKAKSDKSNFDDECPKPEELESPPMSLTRAISISGAAVDSSVVPGAQKKMMAALFNQNLGHYLDNYNCPPSNREWFKHWFAFWPIYYGHYYDRDKHGIRLYLSDGGHSENLGAFSLVRRLPERIIIVDAEQDYNEENYTKHGNGYAFDAYKKLKAGLKAEMGVDFSVPVIDTLVLGKGDTKKSCKCHICPYSTKKSCFDGYIAYFPYPSAEGETPKGVSIYVKYIKLSIDKDNLNQYPPSVKSYFDKSKEEYGKTENGKQFYCSKFLGFNLGCTFPQESTAVQSYTPEQFTAYRDLGRWIIENQCDLDRWIEGVHNPNEEFCYCKNPKDCEENKVEAKNVQ